MSGLRGRYWFATWSCEVSPWEEPVLPSGVSWIRGQREIGEGGFEHWQLVIYYKSKVRLGAVKKAFPGAHLELTRSESAEDYVWKEDTRVEGSSFELGVKPLQRNSSKDWEEIWNQAKSGAIEQIPADVRVRW